MNNPSLAHPSLEQSSRDALAAAHAGDLDALEQALLERQAALTRGEAPNPGVLSSGELTTHLLRDLIRDLRMEDARLRRLTREFAVEPNPSISLRG